MPSTASTISELLKCRKDLNESIFFVALFDSTAFAQFEKKNTVTALRIFQFQMQFRKAITCVFYGDYHNFSFVFFSILFNINNQQFNSFNIQLVVDNRLSNKPGQRLSKIMRRFEFSFALSIQ